MLMDKFKKLTDPNGEENNKKKVENLVVFIIILIITIVAINFIWNDGKKNNNNNNTENTSYKQLASYNQSQTAYNLNNENDIEEKLKNILKSINNVGNVNVFLNYSETSTTQAMYNENTKESTTQETDKSGGSRNVEEKDIQKEIIYTEENGDKKPITQKVVMPKIEGAIITAEGASNSEVRANIVQAVEAVTGLATHKIQVFEMRK